MAYLDRLWAFVSTLEPVHNSLKAHVLYNRLVLDRSQGTYDLAAVHRIPEAAEIHAVCLAPVDG